MTVYKSCYFLLYPYYYMPVFYNINQICQQQQCEKAQINYNSLITGGNDPSITKAMRYSQYIRNSKPKTIYNSDAAARLAQQGITFRPFFSPILVSLQFTNLKEFNMPREKVFSRSTEVVRGQGTTT